MNRGSTRKLSYLVLVLILLGSTFALTNPSKPQQSTLRNVQLASSSAHIAVAGYTQIASDGGIFNFGTSPFYGSMGGHPLNKPIVGMAVDPATGGYWEVASDGGVFSFNAPFFGSMGGHPLNKPIVGMAATPDGGGYWLVASDGGIFSFNAPFYGSMGGKALNQPIVGMAAVIPSSTLLPTGSTGFDLSNYQCSNYQGAAPGAFYILEVSGGPFVNNTCLTNEATFGGPASQGYLFIGNTVPAPQGTKPAPPCPTSVATGLCPSYQLGYQQAQSSYDWATSQGVFPTMWWLDVEDNNCSVFSTGQWMVTQAPNCATTTNPSVSYNTAANAATIEGAFAALDAQGVNVGVYSTPTSWQQITGNLQLPYGTSLWEPLQGGSCSNATGFGGGVVAVVQYQLTASYDSDVAC